MLPNLSSGPALTRDNGSYIKKRLHAMIFVVVFFPATDLHSRGFQLQSITNTCLHSLLHELKQMAVWKDNVSNIYFSSLFLCLYYSGKERTRPEKKQDGGIGVSGLDLTRTPRLLNSAYRADTRKTSFQHWPSSSSGFPAR